MFRYLKLSNRHLFSSPIVLLTALVVMASPSEAHAYDPHLRFPWPASASHNIVGGYSYFCGDHTNNDYYAIDFNFPTVGQEVDATKGGS